MNNEKKGYMYTFTWLLENYSNYWHKSEKHLLSPRFDFEGLEDTHLYLGVYPKWDGDRRADCTVSSRITLQASDNNSEVFKFQYELSILAEDGSAFHTRGKKSPFVWMEGVGFFQFVCMENVRLRRKADFLPNDILSMRCKLWNGEGDLQNVDEIVAQTRLITEDVSFLHVVENFSSLQANVKQKTQVQSPLKKKRVISSSFCLIGDSKYEEKIIIEIASSDASQILKKCEFILLGKSGNIVKPGDFFYTDDVRRTGIHKMSFPLTRQAILSKESEYLPDDKLSLVCQCTFSTYLTMEKIEKTRLGLPVSVKQESDLSCNKESRKTEEIFFGYVNALDDDMRSLYISQRYTDVELKTKMKSFRAHRIVLCARSPVFEAMMASDMKEENTGGIRVDDLEDDTVERLLFFLYSDSLENLQWKSATQLYSAADKYQIGKLKAMCSSFLAENLNTSNTNELLLLAATHNDSTLVKVVKDFITNHHEQFFGSEILEDEKWGLRVNL